MITWSFASGFRLVEPPIGKQARYEVRIEHTHPTCPPLLQGCSLAYAQMFGQVESLKESQIKDLETHSNNSVNFHLSIPGHQHDHNIQRGT
jgi:hypothetical protein